MSADNQAREARAEAHALTKMQRQHMGFWAVKDAYLKGAEEERAAKAGEIIAMDEEIGAVQLERDSLAEKLRVLLEALKYYAPFQLENGEWTYANDRGGRAREALRKVGEEAK